MNITSEKHLLRYAVNVAALNSKANKNAADARVMLSDMWNRITLNTDISSISTGGFTLRRDGEGEIELWINPSLLGWKP